MVSRKRGRAEMESSEPAADESLLTRLRNMWEFANIMQYIFIFGKAVKIDEDFDIEDLEAECIKPGPSEKLAEIGLCLLKFVSSHRGLTPDIFDEYTRRQYVSKAPQRNPYGTEQTPNKFSDFDIFTKLRVLFQLSQWTLLNPDRMRERMPEAKDTDQTSWRIEEVGYDKQERLYFVLDDNRLYRRTDPAIPPPPPKTKAKPKAKSKAGKAAARASKRRKTTDSEELSNDVEPDLGDNTLLEEDNNKEEDASFGGRKWECIAVTLTEYQSFLEGLQKSRDADEKALYTRLSKDVLPVIEKLEEDRQKKIARRQKELLNLEKLATAKRSSRIASKQDKEREEQEAAAAERKRHADLIAAKKDAERQKQMEEARESRMMTREQRLKEREYKRLLHEEELANLSEDSKKLETGEARMSERHLKAEMEKKKKVLDELAQEDEWVFDCSVCGVHGENIDDGSHSIACEECNVWQHSSCLGVAQVDAEKDDFHFVCRDCKRKKEDAQKPKIPPLKFKLGSSSSPPSDKTIHDTIYVNGNYQSQKRKSSDSEVGAPGLPPMKKFKPYFAPTNKASSTPHAHLHETLNNNSMHQSLMNGPTLSPEGQLTHMQGANGSVHPPPGLLSPTRDGTYTNGYHHDDLDQGPYHSQKYSAPSKKGVTGSAKTTNGYGAYQNTHNAPAGYNQGHLVQPSDGPFHNSFDRQRPSSSHSINNVPSPTKNRPPVSPTEGLNFHPASPNTPHANDTTPHHSAATAHSSNYPSFRSGLPSTPAASIGASSSPVIPPPSNPPQSSMAGLSPSKHSPSRPSPNYSVSGTPVVPPTAQLFPSPQMQNLHAPVKGLTPEQAKITPAELNGQ